MAKGYRRKWIEQSLRDWNVAPATQTEIKARLDSMANAEGLYSEDYLGEIMGDQIRVSRFLRACKYFPEYGPVDGC